MTGLRRLLGLFVAAPLLSLSAWSAPVDEVQDLYREGVDLWQRGQYEEALQRFTQVLAMEPDHKAAYELWKSTEQDIILQMLVEGGQYELVAKRFLDLAQMARTERQDDEEAIRELLRQLNDEDALARRRAVLQLGAHHGEFAVQYMLPTLADQDAEDRRVYFMQALTAMDTDVVLPLLAALDGDDAFMRRNVAIVLGYIGDSRAAGKLTRLAEHADDGGVRMAAKEAALRCGSRGDALASFLRDGDDYHHRRTRVLRPNFYSGVVWSWGEDGLAGRPIPRYLYPDELSKGAYYDALEADPGSLDARAGVARAYVAQQAWLMARAEAGLEDDPAIAEQLAEASIAVNASGIDALDRALEWSVRGQDVATGVALTRVLGGLAKSVTPALWSAFHSGDGALAGEAAVAMGNIAYANNATATVPIVAKLGEAAGLEVVRMAVVIDGNARRGAAIAEALEARGMVANHWDRGIKGLNLLRRVPGVDVIVLADVLPDITAAQMLDEIARDERTAGVPVLVVSEDTEAAEEAYGERVAAVIGGADAGVQIDAIEEAMSDGLSGDRERANRLAARAATTLQQLARGSGRTDITPALGPLAATLAGRPDSVTVPAMGALAAAGTPAHVPALRAVLTDSGRSDEARVAAADAIGAVAGRMSIAASGDLIQDFGSVLGSDASLAVRTATARALGRLDVSPAQRAEIERLSRVAVGE